MRSRPCWCRGGGRHHVALLTVLLFAGFLGAKVFLLMGRREQTCGCYGVADADQLDGVSIGTSALLVGLAFAHLWFANSIEPPSFALRIVSSTLFTGVGLWLGQRTWQRQAVEQQLHVAPRA